MNSIFQILEDFGTGVINKFSGAKPSPSIAPDQSPPHINDPDTPPVYKMLYELDPDFRERVEGFLADAEAAGFPLTVSETYRSAERQAWLYGQGRPGYTYNGVNYGRPGDRITNAQPGHGMHERRRALDTWPRGYTYRAKDWVIEDIYVKLEPLRRKWKLKNLPGIGDLDHLEDA